MASNDIDIRGLDDLTDVARAIKAAGTEGKGLRKELYAGMNRATKPVRADLNDSVPPTFPDGGGLAGLMKSRARFGVSTKLGGAAIGVSLVARGKGRRTLQNASQNGIIRHPVFGNRKVWVTQTSGVDKGLPDKAFEKNEPTTKREVLKAIRDVASKVERSA